MSKAVFMGRAGTIHNLQKDGVLNIGDFEIFSRVSEALNTLGQQGYFLAIVGSEKTVPGMDYPGLIWTIEQHIAYQVGYPIAFKLCMHHSAKKCSCRLPKPGLIEQFRDELDLDIGSSVMIASREAEVKGALSAGIENIIRVTTGKGQWTKKSEGYPIFDSLLEAVEHLSEN